MDEVENANLVQDQTRVPLTNIHRLLKKGIPSYGKASKDAKQAAQDLLQDFIGFVTSEAKSISQREKRKVLGGDDILVALDNLGMKKYSDILKEYQKSYRKSVAEVPSDTDGESVALSDAVDDDIDFVLHDCSNRGDFEPLDDPLLGNLSETYKSSRVQPVVKANLSSSNVENGLPSVATSRSRTSEENSNPNFTGDVKKLVPSKAAIMKNPGVAVGSTSAVHHTVRIPALTIPAVFISGIRIPAIDIPELTIPVELVSGDQAATTSEQAVLTMDGEQMVINANENIDPNSGLQEEEHVPGTEVIDLASPTSRIALQLLDCDALDPLDFNPFLEEESETEIVM